MAEEDGSAGRSARRDEAVARLVARTNRLMIIGISGANLAGALVVFVLLAFVLPAPLGFYATSNAVLVRNLIAGALFMPLSLLIGNLWSRRVFSDWSRWLLRGRPPDRDGVRLALRAPLRQVSVSAAMWALATVVFTALNAPVSVRLAGTVVFVFVLGGIVTCALVYLLAERFLRGMTALALAGQPPPRPMVPGVAVRMGLSWALGTGVALLGLVVLAGHSLTDQTVPSTRLAQVVLYVSIVGLIAGCIALLFAARSVADPLAGIRRALGRVRTGDLSVEVPVYDGSEVGLLQAGFNDMVVGLRERERLSDLFGRHVGEAVAQRALERGIELGGETRDVAALFVDLVGSTALAHRRSPNEVVTLLNRFFGLVVEVVDEHDGWVNKFEGDAALCVFGAPMPNSRATDLALAAARALARRLRDELPEVEAGIGVSAGSAVAGNVGAAERFEYTVIGDPINEAARLCELAKGTAGRLLASGATVARARSEEAEHWELGEEVTLRGRDRATRLAAPREEAPASNAPDREASLRRSAGWTPSGGRPRSHSRSR